ncbi:MAG: PilZ domain-containing protein [Candidatus Omnitrophota bacterium]
MEERRMFERVEAPMKVTYTIVDKKDADKNGASTDVSGGGIRITVPEALPVNSKLRLTIKIPQDSEKSMTAFGEVAWCTETPSSDPRSPKSFDVGVRFTQSDPLTIGRIFSYFYNKK